MKSLDFAFAAKIRNMEKRSLITRGDNDSPGDSDVVLLQFIARQFLMLIDGGYAMGVWKGFQSFLHSH